MKNAAIDQKNQMILRRLIKLIIINFGINQGPNVSRNSIENDFVCLYLWANFSADNNLFAYRLNGNAKSYILPD